MRHINQFFLFLLGILLVAGCKKDDDMVNTRVTAVKKIFSPANNYAVDLDKTSSVLFEWDQARAEDGGIVLYSLAFAKPDGDFSDPLYTIVSDGNGLQNKATLNKATLNKIGKLAGLKPLESGQFKWTVFSSKGVNIVPADSSRIIAIQRPAGFDNPPAQLFLTGSATEGGTDLSKAVKFKMVGDGKYELYTSLKPGTYHLVDNTTGDIHQYFVEDGLVREGEGETVVGNGPVKVYRISLDLSVITAKFTEIKEVGLWFAPSNKVLFTLDYNKNGLWVAKDKLITFKQEDWGRDERYKFRVSVVDGSAPGFEWFGSVNGDNNRPTSSTPPSFYYLFPAPANQWDNCFKFITEADNSKCDITVDFSSTTENYTHKVVVD